MLRVDREICEHDVDHVFVFPQTSRQRGVHTSRVCRVYLSLRSPPHFMSRSRELHEYLRVTKFYLSPYVKLRQMALFRGPI